MCLQLLLAREEEVKRRNAVTATKYVGPVVRYHSKCVSKDTEQASSCDEGPDFEKWTSPGFAKQRLQGMQKYPWLMMTI